ncbi:MAG: PA2169 family four-helix-bundle protein [Casimicrobiaceae bacterium]
MNDNIESTLNELIETSKDGEQGFQKAAREAKAAELTTLFTQCAARCAEGARELQGLVGELGGDPEKSGSIKAALHRGWISVKDAVTHRDDHAVLEEVERGEDYAKAQYKKALEHDLTPKARTVVERQYQGVIANHDKVKALRDKYRS